MSHFFVVEFVGVEGVVSVDEELLVGVGDGYVVVEGVVGSVVEGQPVVDTHVDVVDVSAIVSPFATVDAH